jgi:hypothetical protein
MCNTGHPPGRKDNPMASLHNSAETGGDMFIVVAPITGGAAVEMHKISTAFNALSDAVKAGMQLLMPLAVGLPTGEDHDKATATALRLSKMRDGYAALTLERNLHIESRMRVSLKHGRGDAMEMAEYITRKWGAGAAPPRSVINGLVDRWWIKRGLDDRDLALLEIALRGPFPGVTISFTTEAVVNMDLYPAERSYSSLAQEALDAIPGARKIVYCPHRELERVVATPDPAPDPVTMQYKRCATQAAIGNLIQHLNDHHQWSFDKIADWLDGLHTSGQFDLSVVPPTT